MANQQTMVSVGTPVTNIASGLRDSIAKAGEIYSDFHKNKMATEEANRRIREENLAINQRNFLSQYDPMSRAGIDGYGMDESSLKYAMENEQKARDKHAQDIAAGIERESAEELESNLLKRRRTLVTAEGLGSAIAQDLISNNVDPSLVQGMLGQYTAGLQSREDLLAREKANVEAFNRSREAASNRLAQIVGYGAQQDNNYASNLRMNAGGTSSSGSGAGKGKTFNIKDYDAYSPEFAEYLDKADIEAWHSFEGKAVRNVQGAMRNYRALVNDSYNNKDTYGSKVDGTNHELFAFLQEHIKPAFLSSRGKQLSIDQMTDLLDEKFTPWKRNKDIQEAAIVQRMGGTSTQERVNIPAPRQLYTPNELQWLKQQDYQQVRGWDQIARERVFDAYADLVGDNAISAKKTASGDTDVLPRPAPRTDADDRNSSTQHRDKLDKASDHKEDTPADKSANTASGLILSRENIKPPAGQSTNTLEAASNIPKTSIDLSTADLDKLSENELSEARVANTVNMEVLEKVFKENSKSSSETLKRSISLLDGKDREEAYKHLANYVYTNYVGEIDLDDYKVSSPEAAFSGLGASQNAAGVVHRKMTKELIDRGIDRKTAEDIVNKSGYGYAELADMLQKGHTAQRNTLSRKNKEEALRNLLQPSRRQVELANLVGGVVTDLGLGNVQDIINRAVPPPPIRAPRS